MFGESPIFHAMIGVRHPTETPPIFFTDRGWLSGSRTFFVPRSKSKLLILGINSNSSHRKWRESLWNGALEISIRTWVDDAVTYKKMERMGVDRPDRTWHKSNLWAHHFRREFTPCLLIPSGLGRITSIPVSRRAHWSRSPVYSPGGFLDQNQLFGLKFWQRRVSNPIWRAKRQISKTKGPFFLGGGP